MMEKASESPCPRCGCQDCRQIGDGGSWGGGRVRLACNNCNHRFSAARNSEPDQDAANDQPRPVVYQVMCCPFCQSTRVPVVSTRRPVRWHRCGSCQRTFKSVESKAVTGRR